MRIDLTDVNDDVEVLTVPEGVYDVRIVDVRLGHTRDGSERWALRLEVVGGDWAGKNAGWDGLIWSDRGKPRVKRVLTALGYPPDREFDLEPDELIGRQGRVQVLHEEYENAAGVVTKHLNVPYEGWGPFRGDSVAGVAEPAVDGDRAGQEALARDSPF
jgi:uncharacterized protein DUF669